MHTENDDMPYPHILKRAVILIHKYFVQLVQCIESLHYVSEYRVFAVEVVDVVTEGDEELAPTPTLLALQRRCNSHRNGPPMRMFELWTNFGGKIAGGWCGGWGIGD